jgi:hypothetical protein
VGDYKTIFEYKNEMIGTWEDSASDVDRFVEGFLSLPKVRRVKKLIKVYEKVDNGKTYLELQVDVRKYNQMLKEVQ